MAVNSVRERILLAVMVAVRTPVQALGATLHRSPAVAIAREQCPALAVYPESDAIASRANDRVTRELTVRMTALARAVPPATPETEADRLLVAAHAALMADVNVGGLALSIHELDCEWDIEDADAVAAAIPARYRITYRTLAADLTTSA
ncbi:hypothetical protein [Ralstonia solanacearum]|uniref:hypothetical protein n=1 Tax=Ralstonia solanacearum TaxID=305 RepID=UPI0018D0FBAC|nr:hypothetical protein [Ralstonia solanacearum]MDC6212711.1 hypothetical protein [Ralstonia solanacearum]MDD7803258.1 hypothetical protein [Ralstonia solanacearum]